MVAEGSYVVLPAKGFGDSGDPVTARSMITARDSFDHLSDMAESVSNKYKRALDGKELTCELSCRRRPKRTYTDPSGSMKRC